MSSRSSIVFDRGIEKALKKIDRQLSESMNTIALELLVNAIRHWVENNNYNLTGNTINSYASAVYKNGALIRMYDARDAGVNNEATSTYTQPGKEILVYPTRDSEIIDEDYERDMDNYTVVKDYKRKKSGLRFQYVDAGYGAADARKILRSMHPEGRYSIVVCVGTPYANYLYKSRNLDVLEKAAEAAENKAICNPIFAKARI